jgi:hypothetical protein
MIDIFTKLHLFFEKDSFQTIPPIISGSQDCCNFKIRLEKLRFSSDREFPTTNFPFKFAARNRDGIVTLKLYSINRIFT